MKTLKNAAREFADTVKGNYSTRSIMEQAFLAGAKEAERRIPVTEELPELNETVIGFNEMWIDSTNNPEGSRECFRSVVDDNDWISSRWDMDLDSYVKDVGVEPTHWRPIVRK